MNDDQGWYEEENMAELIRAESMCNQAQKMAMKENFRGAMNLFLKAIKIYVNVGAYMKVSETFNQLVVLVQRESDILIIMEKVRGILETMESLDLGEEIAKLKLALANLNYKNEDYQNAGNLFAEVAELFFQVDPDDYRQLSGMFLLRAGECFEKISRTEKGEKYVIEAIKRFDVSIFDYHEHLQQLEDSVSHNKFEQALDNLNEITDFFWRLEKELENVEEDNDTYRNLKNNVAARLIHTISEYDLLKMVCYRKLEDEEKVKTQADENIKNLKEAIQIIKSEIQQNQYSSADLHRLTFDLFMLQFNQEYADYQVEDPIGFLTYDLSKEMKEILVKMQFYQNTIQILDYGIENTRDTLKELPLSQILDPFREFISDFLLGKDLSFGN